MNTFTTPEQTVLYQIVNLRSEDYTLIQAKIEEIADTTTLQSLVDKCDVAFDASGNLIYAPYPRR